MHGAESIELVGCVALTSAFELEMRPEHTFMYTATPAPKPSQACQQYRPESAFLVTVWNPRTNYAACKCLLIHCQEEAERELT